MYDSNWHKMYPCTCICGATRIIRESSLLNNTIKGCIECGQIVNPGDVFGELEVLERVDRKDAYWTKFYKCRCICGAEGVVRSGDLKLGKTTWCRSFKNKIVVENNTAKIYMHNGSFAIIDADDIHLISAYKWHISKSKGYCSTNAKGKYIELQNLILKENSGYLVDHINRDPLDCTRNNLRYATKALNSINSKISSRNVSGYRGVGAYKDRPNKWLASIRVSNKQIFLGRYDTLEEAIEARKAAEIKYFGENSPQYREEELTKTLVMELEEKY